MPPQHCMPSRSRMRYNDINESYYVLMELACCEPVLQQCFHILEDICLAHGVKIKGAKPDFQRFIDTHWIPFFRDALRAMHIYGFVPYRLKRLKSGDKVPQVLPPGTFRWNVISDEKSDDILSYKITLMPGLPDIDPILIHNWTQPNYSVSENSILYATVSSPMSYVIESYKMLQDALKRQAHADAWNCTARLAIANEPKDLSHDAHRRELFNTFGLSDLTRAAVSEDLQKTFEDNSMNHFPAVYDLPKHRHIENASTLKPCSDIMLLTNKYKYDVCYLLGIPPDFINISTNPHNQVQSNKNQGHSRLFQARSQCICQFLTVLGSRVYREIYKTEAVFEIIPMPRLEIESLQDLQVLFDVGVLQPEHTVNIGDVMLGSFKKKPKTMPQQLATNATSLAESQQPAKTKNPEKT